MKGPTAGVHEYFSLVSHCLLSSTHLTTCHSPWRERRKRREEDRKLMSPKINSEEKRWENKQGPGEGGNSFITPATHKKRERCPLLTFTPRERKKRRRREGKQEPKYLCNYHYHLQGGKKERKERRKSKSTSADKVKVRQEETKMEKAPAALSVTASVYWVAEQKD